MRAPQERRGRTRAALLDAARAIAAAEGLGQLRAEAVAQRAGTAKGTFFAHFPDKDHLVAALVAERINALDTPRSGPGLGQGLGPAHDAEALIAGFGPLISLMVAEPEVLPVMTRFAMPEGDDVGMGAAIHARIAATAAVVAQTQAVGRLRAGDPGLLAEGLMAFAFHTSASAMCSTAAGPANVAAPREFARLARLWLSP